MKTGSATIAVNGSPSCATLVVRPLTRVRRTWVPGWTVDWACTAGVSHNSTNNNAPADTNFFITPPLDLCGNLDFSRKGRLEAKLGPSRVVGVRWRAVGAEDAPGTTILRGGRRLARNGEGCSKGQPVFRVGGGGFGRGRLQRFTTEDPEKKRGHGDFT